MGMGDGGGPSSSDDVVVGAGTDRVSAFSGAARDTELARVMMRMRDRAAGTVAGAGAAAGTVVSSSSSEEEEAEDDSAVVAAAEDDEADSGGTAEAREA